MRDDGLPPAGSEVLLLEDDAVLRKRLSAYLRGRGAEVSEVSRLEEARRLLKEVRFDFALVDLHLPDGEVLDLLRERAFSETTDVVVMTAFGGVQQAVEAMRLGAADFLSKPFETEVLPLVFGRCRAARSAVRREQHRAATEGAPADGLFFGASLQTVRAQLDTILATERRLERGLPPVLIEGETGTGKSVLARWLHAQGPRAVAPLVTINCASLPETLVEAELFGHERGAFTDAKHARIGLFEAADSGTLFLDEVASLTPATQARLLTAIEDGRIRRVGGTREQTVDVRLITASNQPVAELVKAGRFREDLFHRLDLLRIVLPPLRERGADLPALARHLLDRIAAKHRVQPPAVTAAGEVRLRAHAWPGNIRELAHELERAVIFGHGQPLDFPHLAPVGTTSDGQTTATVPWRNPAWFLPENGFSLDQAVAELITDALRATDGNISAAARRLGVTREFLRYRVNQTPRQSEV